jgi:hypothetical protein
VNEYIGLSFLIPSMIGFVGFGAWLMVVSRMTNLRIKFRWRLALFVWSLNLLCLAVMDVSMVHGYASELDVVSLVLFKTVARAGWVGIAVAVYVMLGRLHPIRMCLSPVEESPKQMPVVLYDGRKVATNGG